MSPECKSVKLVSLACLFIGIVVLGISVYAFVGLHVDFLFGFMFLAMGLELAIYGFTGARSANVPSEIAKFAKSAYWAPLFCICVIAYYFLNEPESMLFLVTAIVCAVGCVVLALVVKKVVKAIQSV